jgi:hypothetical protein
MTLHNISPEQLNALQSNFENLVIKPAEEKGKYDVQITLETEIDYWKLFFSGADYTLAKMGRSSLNIKPILYATTKSNPEEIEVTAEHIRPGG